jgi:hypothetical protein
VKAAERGVPGAVPEAKDAAAGLNLKVIKVEVRGGRATVRLQDQAHAAASATTITLHFPVETAAGASYAGREAEIVERALRVLHAVELALKER